LCNGILLMVIKLYPNTTVVITGGGSSGITDTFSLKITAADSNATPTDNSTFKLTVTEPESNNTPTDTATLKFPTPPDFGDTNTVPTDARTMKLRVWLSGSTGTSNVTNPANANGQNNGVFSSQTTTVGGASTSQLTSQLGSNIGTITFTAAIYRGWFDLTTTLVTSVVSIVAHSSSALFTDVTIFTFSGLNGSVNHDAGDFTFDLIAAGINTLTKLQSLVILHNTSDAVGGVTPAVLKVDAGAAEITAVI
jgi:hypothetical protein